MGIEPPLPDASGLQVRLRRPEDFPAIRALAERVYPQAVHPPEAVWTDLLLASHLSHFPEGQVVAVEASGRVVGDATALRVPRARALEPHTWDGITDFGTLGTHDPEGDTFYGVDIMVDPALRGVGVGNLLYQARFALAGRLGCRAFVAGARIPGFQHYAGPVSRYVEEVVAGSRFDPTLSRQLRQGFTVAGILPDYFPDPESRNFAVLIQRPIP